MVTALSEARIAAVMAGDACWWEMHEEVAILVADYRNNRAIDLPPTLECVTRAIRDRPRGSVRILSLVHGAEYSREVMDAMIPFVRDNRPWVAASAVVGLDHLSPLVNLVNRLTGARIRAFDTDDAARLWLLANGSRHDKDA